MALRGPGSAARTVYIGLFASTVIVSAGALAVSLTLGTMSTGIGTIDWIAMLLGVGVLGIVWKLRTQIARRNPERSSHEWWERNAGSALTLWALLEFISLIGAVVLFVTGHVVAFAVLVFLALAGLIILSPGRLASA